MQKTKLGKYKIIKSEPLENRYGKPIPRESIKREIEESRRLAELQDLRSTQQAALKFGKSYEEMMSDKLFSPVTRRLDSMTRRLDNLSPFETDEEGKPLTETVKDDEGKEQKVLKIKPTLKNYLNFIKNINAHIEAIKLDSDALKNIANQLNVIHEKISKDIEDGKYTRSPQLDQLNDMREDLEDLKTHLSSSTSTGPNLQESQELSDSVNRLQGGLQRFLTVVRSSKKGAIKTPQQPQEEIPQQESSQQPQEEILQQESSQQPSSSSSSDKDATENPSVEEEEEASEEEAEEEAEEISAIKGVIQYIDDLVKEKELKDTEKISELAQKIKSSNLSENGLTKILDKLESIDPTEYKYNHTLSGPNSEIIKYMKSRDVLSNARIAFYNHVIPAYESGDSKKSRDNLVNHVSKDPKLISLIRNDFNKKDVKEFKTLLKEFKATSLLTLESSSETERVKTVLEEIENK